MLMPSPCPQCQNSPIILRHDIEAFVDTSHVIVDGPTLRVRHSYSREIRCSPCHLTAEGESDVAALANWELLRAIYRARK